MTHSATPPMTPMQKQIVLPPTIINAPRRISKRAYRVREREIQLKIDNDDNDKDDDDNKDNNVHLRLVCRSLFSADTNESDEVICFLPSERILFFADTNTLVDDQVKRCVCRILYIAFFQ
jgi:hypothetical protein